MPGALILINGFPAVGKHAVARELVTLLPECKFFDTRNLVSAASQLYASDDPAHGLLRKNLKHAIFDSIARVYTTSPTAPPPPTYVLTDFLSVAARQIDRDIMAEFVAFAKASGFAFIHVILGCSADENVRRLACRHIEAASAIPFTPTSTPTTPLSPSIPIDLALACDSTSPSAGPAAPPSPQLPSLYGAPTSNPSYAHAAATFSPPGTVGSAAMDASALLQVRMEEEIGHMAPLAGLCGEFELDTTRLDASTTAGVLAEYCLDTLRREGWWIQLNAAGAGGVGKSAGASGGQVRPSISVTDAEANGSGDKNKTPSPSGAATKRSAASKLGLSLGIKKKSFSAR